MKRLSICRQLIASTGVSGLVLFLAIPNQANGQEYEIGGPLAGVKLPLYKTQHGEPAGYPGCLVGGECLRDRVSGTHGNVYGDTRGARC